METVINLPSSNTWLNLNTISGATLGKSLIIFNLTASPLFLLVSDTEPDTDSPAYVLKNGVQGYLQANSTTPMWVKGSGGPIVVQYAQDVEFAQMNLIGFQQAFITSEKEGFARLRVDEAQTSFFEGREGRCFHELSILSGATYVIKAVVPVDTILFDLEVAIGTGALTIKTYRGGTEGGIFSTAVSVLPKNAMISAKNRYSPNYTLQTTLSAGGTYSNDGTYLDIIRIKAASATAQQSSVSGGTYAERGVSPATYYFTFTNTSNETATGTFRAWWEERP